MTFDALRRSAPQRDSTLCGRTTWQGARTPTKAANAPPSWRGSSQPGAEHPVRTITITYTAYPAETNHLGNPITPPLNNSSPRAEPGGRPDPTGLPFTLPTLTSSPLPPRRVWLRNLVVTKSPGPRQPTPANRSPTRYRTNTGTATAYDPHCRTPSADSPRRAPSRAGHLHAGAGPGPAPSTGRCRRSPRGANALVYTFTTTLVSPSITTAPHSPTRRRRRPTTPCREPRQRPDALSPLRPASGSGSVTRSSLPSPPPRRVQRVGDRSGKPALRLGPHVTDTTAAPANNVS